MKQLTESDRPDFSRAVEPGDTALANALMSTFGPSSPASLRESRTSQQLAKTLGDLDKPERGPSILDHVKACIPFWRDTEWADDMSFHAARELVQAVIKALHHKYSEDYGRNRFDMKLSGWSTPYEIEIASFTPKGSVRVYSLDFSPTAALPPSGMFYNDQAIEHPVALVLTPVGFQLRLPDSCLKWDQFPWTHVNAQNIQGLSLTPKEILLPIRKEAERIRSNSSLS